MKKMSEEEITALAREYAEKHDNISMFYHIARDLLTTLQDRYYIIEKHKVEEEYNLALSNFEKAGSIRPLNQSYFDGRSDVIKSLFPDLGKEVEGCQ